jgi:hypothetical protein
VSYVEGKYNMKILIILFTKVTSISIHHLSSYKIYKRCHMTFAQVVEHNPPTKNKRSMRTLFSRHVLRPRLQAIKLLASITYPLKIIKGPLTYATSRYVRQPTSHQHPTQRWGQQRVLWVQVAPEAKAPKPAAQERQSLLPSPHARGPAARWRARGI